MKLSFKPIPPDFNDVEDEYLKALAVEYMESDTPSEKRELLIDIHRYCHSQKLPFPEALIRKVLFAIEDLHEGLEPELFKVERGRGAPVMQGSLMRYVQYAVCYGRLCRDGEIDSPRFRKDVMEAFGVKESTVKEWFRQELSDECFAKLKAALLRERAPGQTKLEAARMQILLVGQMYRDHPKSRSANSIEARDSKRGG